MVYGMTRMKAIRKMITPIAAPADASRWSYAVTIIFVASTSVATPGPLRVTIHTMSKTFSELINNSDTSTMSPERMFGIITENRIRSLEAPSTSAASIISCSSVVRNEDWMMMTENPRYCHIKITISQYVAVAGSLVNVNGDS